MGSAERDALEREVAARLGDTADTLRSVRHAIRYKICHIRFSERMRDQLDALLRLGLHIGGQPVSCKAVLEAMKEAIASFVGLRYQLTSRQLKSCVSYSIHNSQQTQISKALKGCRCADRKDVSSEWLRDQIINIF